MDENNEPWITTIEAAAILGVDRITLSKWSHTSKGPPYYSIGGQRRYLASEVRAYVTRSRVEPEGPARG